MELDDAVSKKVFQHSTESWSEENGCIIVNQNGNSILLNITTSIVWRLIDGISSTDKILKFLVDTYGEHNEESYLIELLTESIDILTNMGVIKER